VSAHVLCYCSLLDGHGVHCTVRRSERQSYTGKNHAIRLNAHHATILNKQHAELFHTDGVTRI